MTEDEAYKAHIQYTFSAFCILELPIPERLKAVLKQLQKKIYAQNTSPHL